MGRSLSTYINYYLCQGQQQAAALGYSPLPFNLVSGAFLQVNKIPGTVGAPNINSYGACNNPTFTQGGQDILLKDAPYPDKCQKIGSALNCSTTGGSTGSSSTTTQTGKTGKGKKSTSTTGGTGTHTGTGTGTGTGTSTGTNGSTPAAQNADVTGSVVNVAGNGADGILLAVITAVAVAVAVAAPPSVAAYMRRRKGGAE